MHKKIINNILSITFGKGFDLILNFIAVTIIARYLGASQYGIFTSTVALVFILSKIIDLGFPQIVFRETSSKKEDFSFLNNALSVRILVFLFVVTVYNLVSVVSTIEKSEIIYTNILFLSIIFSAKFQNFRELLEIPFKVHLKMNLVMMFNVLDNLILLVLILSLYFYGGSVLLIVIYYVFSNIPGFIVLLLVLKKKYNYKFRFTLKKSKWLIKESIPLFGAALLFALFQQLDVILLKNFISSYSAGIYSAALRLAMPLGILPLALITTVFPFMVKNKTENVEVVKTVTIIVYKILFISSLFSAVVITFKSEEIIVLIFGVDFIEASIPLVFIFWSYLFIFFNNFAQNILTINNKQKNNFSFSLILLVSNLSVLGLIISSQEATGASIAKLVASVIGFCYLLYKQIELKIFNNFVSSNIIFWSLAIMGTVYFLKDINIFIYIISFTLISVLYIFIFKVFRKNEFKLLFRLLNEPAWFPQKLIK